ncbi:UUP1 family membrane protein [Candidatus Poribacteria bacterium]|nr:UUP1 family membrane protein [Candidatus Poribacteria bacterium]
MRRRDRIAVLSLVIACYSLMFYTIHKTGHSISGVLPQRNYDLMLNMSLDGHDDDISLKVALPLDTDRQRIREELIGSPEFAFHILGERLNRWGIWEKRNAKGHHVLVYRCTVRTEARKYKLPAKFDVLAKYPQTVEPYLLASEHIQSDSPEIRQLFERLVPPPDRGDTLAITRTAFSYTSETIKAVELKGTTDALTCFRLGEASCGGKARLFVALCRTGGLPARLVQGLILKGGTWRSSHIWAEVWMAGHWAPFCPLNGYFAEVPSSYLILCYGDEPLITHTRDINLQYYFHGKKTLAPPPEAMRTLRQQPGGMLNLWATFERVGIPLNLLKIILMIPFGALVVVVARDIVGIQTFGTFMPALMAVAFRDTGLAWGLALLGAILLFGTAARFGLQRFRLLHTPRLAIILTTTVAFMMTITTIGVATGQVLATRVSLFPLAILTLTVERFAIICEEEGLPKALKIATATGIVAVAAYLPMQWETLQVIVVTFPETLLLVIAVFFIVGRWTGMRLTEYIRFREFIAGK